jgi:prolyl-tRNA synthetase
VRKIAVNKEIYNDEILSNLGLNKDELVEERAVEVGNIFSLGSKYSDALDLYFTDDQGKQKSILMGCYGLGISRLMGLLAEHFADDKGLVWPEEVAPAKVYLVRLGDNPDVVKQADKLYECLTAADIQVLYDDRDARAGEKFVDADLLGIPHRVVISDKTASSDILEWKRRTTQVAEQISVEQLLKTLGIDA